MTEILLKLFVKDHDKPERADVRERYGVLASVVGIVLNILLATMKLIMGVFVGSIAVIADAVNNYSDAGSSLVSFVSFKIASKPADRDHPFGHARIEYVCSMIVAFIILVVGVEFMIESVNGFFDGGTESGGHSIATYVILGIAIISKLWLALFNRKMGRRINSSVLVASGMDAVLDALSTTAVLASNIIVAFTNWWFLDSIVGIAVSLLILVAGFKILNETKNSLLGEAPLEDVTKSIEDTVKKYDEVVGIHDMMVHNYGPNHFIASFHAEVDGNKDIYMLHDTIDNIEREINDKLGILCTIHMDPIVTDNEEVTALRELTSAIVVSLYEGASIHDFRTVIGHTHTNLIFDIALPFEIKKTNAEVIEEVSAAVKDVRQDYFCVITVDRQ